MHADDLIVPTRPEAKLDGGPGDRHLMGQQVAAIEILAVRRDRIDLTCLVPTMNEAVSPTTAPSSADHHNLAVQHGPLALHT